VSNKDYFKGNVMSNDNAIVRCFKLWAKISMMVVDGSRDATSVADALQGILNQSQQKSVFDPVAFIGEGWSFAEARNPRSAALGLLDDYSKVKLTTDWLEGKLSVGGETRRTRIIADTASTPLNADHFLYLWKNKEKIPEEWKNVKGVITFDGDVLRGPGGHRYVLCLFWRNDWWCWGYSWLDFDWSADYPSVVLAS
jgi:hypothetical protein